MRFLLMQLSLLLSLVFCGKEEGGKGSGGTTGDGTVKMTAVFTYSEGGSTKLAAGADMFIFKVGTGESAADWTYNTETNTYKKKDNAVINPAYSLRADAAGKIGHDIEDNVSYAYVYKLNLDPAIWGDGTFRTNGQPVGIQHGETVAPRTKMYYQYRKDGNGAGQGLMTVYVQIKEDTYTGHRIARFTDPAEEIYLDYFRYNGSHLYTYDGGVMTRGIVLLTEAESEFVYKRSDGRIDFTGGYHGDEIMTGIQFFADGTDITDLNHDIPLTACSAFYYAERSTMHESPKGTTSNPLPVAGHPVDCDHTKRTEFTTSGYTTRNSVTWRQNVPVEVLYGGICCTSRNLTKYGKTDKDMSQWRDLDTYDNSLFGGTGWREYHAYNPDTGLGVFCTSKVVSTSGALLDAQQVLDIRDNGLPANYKKYYRGSGKIDAVSGETWETEMRIEIKMIE